MHSAPTLGLACAHIAPGCVVGLARPCCRPGPTMLQRWPGRVIAHARPLAVPLGPCHAPYPRAERRVARPLHRIMALPPVVSHLSLDKTPRPSRALVMIRPFVSQHNPSAARPSRTRCSPSAQAGRIVACLGRIVATIACTARPYRGCARLCRAPSWRA